MTGTSVAVGSEGKRNRVGMKRGIIEAEVDEFGFYMSFTKRSLDMDTERGLLSRYVRGIGEAQGDMREAQIRSSLLSASEQNRVFGGDATIMREIDENCVLDFTALRMMDQALTDARCPLDTTMITGSTKVDTKVIPAARYVYVGSELRPTLEDMVHGTKELWVPVEMYAAAGTTADGEAGKIGNFRFIIDNEFPNYAGQGADAETSAGAPGDDDDAEKIHNRHTTVSSDGVNAGDEYFDVFPVLFVGSGSFATVGFAGDVARVTTIMPKADAHNDMYGKKGAVSISWYYGMMVLQKTWIRQIAVSAKIA